jgi:hypothetical protein
MTGEHLAARAQRHVFVGGVHRSGTTLIADLLAGHSQVSGLDDTGVPENEGQHLQDVYPTAGGLGGFGRFAFSARAHMTEQSPLANVESRQRLMASWSPFWDLSKPVLLEKSPPNVLKTRFLQALFPNSAFMMVLRHPLAVTYATHRMLEPWQRLDIHTHIENWLLCYETLLRDGPHLKALALVRYEDFISDPPGQLVRLQRAADLAPEPPTREVRGGLNEAYFARWDRWRLSPLKRSYRAYLGRRFESRLNRFGYSLRPPDARRAPAEDTAHWFGLRSGAGA